MKKLSREEFIEKANAVHNHKYDYSLVEHYGRGKDKITVICHEKDRYGNEHGPFSIRAESHTYGKCGCPKCAQEKRGFKPYITEDIFKEKATVKHSGKYIYDKNLCFKNSRDYVNIKCPIHGYFRQTAHAHLQGQGCPQCNESKIEAEISNLLSRNNIDFKRSYKAEWLGRQHLDFYLPQHNIAIECQGIQHFEPTDFCGKGKEYAEKSFKRTKELDNTKKRLCETHGIKLIYFANKKYDDIVITETDTLLNEITA